MSSKQNYNIEIDEECDYFEEFLYTDDSTGLPIDLTGYRAELQVRTGANGTFSGVDSPTAALVFNTDPSPGGINLGGATGLIQVNIPYSATYQLQWTNAIYSLVLISPSASRTIFISGLFVVISNPSKLGNSLLT